MQRLIWILFVFPLVEAEGLFSEHLVKYVNHSIDVCDDFYDHVCSAVPNDKELFRNRAGRQFKETLYAQMLPEGREFLEKHEVLLKQSDLYKNLENALTSEAWYRYVQSEKFQRSQKEMQLQFDGLKVFLVKGLKDAPWTKYYPHLHRRLANTELSLLEPKDFNVTEQLTTAINKLKLCETSHDPLTKCISDALKILQFGSTDGLFSIVSRFGRGTVRMTALYYAVDFGRYATGSLFYVLAHELGHSFFGKSISASPSNSDCFKAMMDESCALFYGRGSPRCPINGSEGAFNEDVADWLAMKTITSFLKSYVLHFPHREKEVWTDLFYAHAIFSCTDKADERSHNYSPWKIRVNGIDRLFPEFAKNFNCKAGDRMVKAEEDKCDPFTGPGAPEIRK